mgnify:CR=1 FL=1
MYEDIVLKQGMTLDDILILSEDILIPVQELINLYNNLYEVKK